MNVSNTSLFNAVFSHIYIEKAAMQYPMTQEILTHFPHSQHIEINHYKEVFSKSHQNFNLEKRSQKLILAVKQPPFLYEGADVCQDFGHHYFYYTATMMNCIYNCEYCYLQGMYPSADIVVFVNLEDVFQEATELSRLHPVYICISYDTDLLAMEAVTHHVSRWYELAAKTPTLTLELRTKSANYQALASFKPLKQFILAWTLSPQPVITAYEKGTPSLKRRLASCQQALEAGWPVRLCFDPMLYIPHWQEIYHALVTETFEILPADKIQDVSIGTFRIGKDYLKTMRKHNPEGSLLQYPFETIKGVCSYERSCNQKMLQQIKETISHYIPLSKIYE